MGIRIALCGASGTGKTTLAKWTETELGLRFNPVGSRYVAKAMGFECAYDVDAAGKRAEFQRRLVTEKRDWENQHDSFITDRTTLDNLVYTMVHDIYAVDAELLQQVVDGMKRYTHVIYCPVAAFCKVSTDEHRVGGGRYGKVGDKTYHVLYDVILRGLLDKYQPKNTPQYTLNSDNLEVRKKGLREFLSQKTLPGFILGQSPAYKI